MRKSPLRQLSKKQAKKNAEWSRIKDERIAALIDKYDYLPCERCMAAVRIDEADPHHEEGRGEGKNVLSNCRILHRECHNWMTTHPLESVPDRLGY